MGVRFFSDKNRPTHLGPYRLETLTRKADLWAPDLIPPHMPLSFSSDDPNAITNAMRDHQAMLDAIREGIVNPAISECPTDRQDRANHLKSFGYFNDASMMGTCLISPESRLKEPYKNPDIDRLAEDLRTKQTKTLASGIDLIMADLRESMEAPSTSIDTHTHALVFIYEHPRPPQANEPGTDWIKGAIDHRSALLASEAATVIANYLRLLGYPSRAHTSTTSDVDLNHLAVNAGLAIPEGDQITAPFIGSQLGIAAVTTTFEMASDQSLADLPNTRKSQQAFAKRRFKDGPHPFEKLKRVDTPTTYMDEARIPRVPKRTDMFSRALFGDMGKHLQEGAKGGKYVNKAAPSSAQRRALGAFVLLQDGPSSPTKTKIAPQEAADLIKATSYFLGADAVGISRCPDWSWYSHDAAGEPIEPPHDQAISLLIDQGFASMDGSSGDDWIAVAQSMRAYLRFSLLGGVIAKQIRNLGYKAKAHTVIDGEVLQPPLLLLAGLGEVSRIGEVILNPYLGPRLKSGAITTDLPLAHDKPIDFGLQKFCESCLKCARECPSGAITAGPKLMFNGYETWKSDSQKCTTYRITTEGGAMCGRCMKTCPWNLEGILADTVLRWTAMKVPSTAPLLARLDDMANRGGLNPVKKWWWDLEKDETGSYRPTQKPVNTRDLQKDLNLKFEDQTLAVYPANLAPDPYPYPYPMDREKGIEAYQAMITAEEYQHRLAKGENPAHTPRDHTESPVLQVIISKAETMAEGVVKYEFQRSDGGDLPPWDAGGHLDIVVAPEFLRQYSMSGDPADRSTYQIGVLKEDNGRGGSALLHRIFHEGRKIFVSKPINHFPLHEEASKTILMGGGIGITPMIAMAHRLHALGKPFELHYSGRSRDKMGYLNDLRDAPWAKNVQLHVSSETGRADLSSILRLYVEGTHVYTCGGESFMSAVMAASEAAGYPEDNTHLEYFSVPELPEYENLPFTLRLAKSGKEFNVPADKTAADVLNENGFEVDVKCSDGICGVCKCDVTSGEVEHRDFVLSNAQRKDSIILCQSRAQEKDGMIEIDL